MVIKLSSKPHGEVVKTSVFIGWAENGLTLAGTLYLDVGQWQELGASIGLGAEMINDSSSMEIVKVIFEGDEKVIGAQS